MPRHVNPNPSYLHHRKSGKARVVVYNHEGLRKEILLPGVFNSKESLEEYHRICALLRTNSGRLPSPRAATVDVTVAELVLRYMEYAKTYYIDPVDKTVTGEILDLTLSFRPLCRLYGPIPVVEFDSLMLEALQQAMATGSWMNTAELKAKAHTNRPLGLARSTLNQRIDRIKRLFRWGCAKKIVPPENLTNLLSVVNLRRYRSAARESPPVLPVDPEVVEATLPFIPTVPADMVRLLLLSGCRIGELCRLTGEDLDRSGPVWLYSPAKHKTAHRGHRRTIAFGPKARLILQRYLTDDPTAPLFSPAVAAAHRKQERRRARKTPVQPSQRDRSKRSPKRKPGAFYVSRAVNHAIRRACIKAKVPIWHTHQLRHASALMIEREFGLEAARATLGHRQVNMTAMYSGLDVKKAAEVASKIG